MENLFERATKNRAVAETHCNSRSSRSHSVFTLKISGKNVVTSETCVGKWVDIVSENSGRTQLHFMFTLYLRAVFRYLFADLLVQSSKWTRRVLQKINSPASSISYRHKVKMLILQKISWNIRLNSAYPIVVPLTYTIYIMLAHLVLWHCRYSESGGFGWLRETERV